MGNGVRVNFSDTQSFEHPPVGAYQVEVTGFEERESEKGEFNYWNWELTITEGDFAGGKMWIITSFSPKASFKLLETLIAFGADEEELRSSGDLNLDDEFAEQFIGAECLATVTMQSYNGERNPRVKKVSRPAEKMQVLEQVGTQILKDAKKFGPTKPGLAKKPGSPAKRPIIR